MSSETPSKSQRNGVNGGSTSTMSGTSSLTDKSASPSNVSSSPPAVKPPTKRAVRELLETRNTTSKMEIGQGVLLTADISGAELVIIRGQFEGKVKAQCVDIEQGAEVKGTVECEAARIDGKFDGVFMSVHSLHLASHANVSGRIIYRRLKVAKGAQLYGHSEYRSPVIAPK